MNSYLVDITSSMGYVLGLSTKGDRLQVHVWENYKKNTLTNIKHHYMRVQDAFFGLFWCLFDNKFSVGRVSNDAWDKVNPYGCIFLQFLTFSYLRVGYFKGEPNTLPRYLLIESL